MNASSSTSTVDPRPLDGDTRTSSSSRSLHVERVACRSIAGYQSAWAALALRAMDANIFLDPGFALPLIQHVEAARRPDFLLVWEDPDAAFGRLVGLMPLSRARSWRIARAFDHKQASLGTPLLDRDCAMQAFEAMLQWLRDQEPGTSALLVPKVPAASAFHVMLLHRGAAAGRRLVALDEHERAALKRPEAPGPSTVVSLASAKRRKELGRQSRRLSQLGQRRYASARTPDEVARAAERFLALEHDGWKGGRGTALLADPRRATFTRAMTRLLAEEGRCRIDALEIDGRAVAMGIVLSAGDRAFFWKTTFDEAYAQLSPGVQFALELTRLQRDDAAIALTDSCAVPNHPMIDRIWPDRMAILDLMIELRPEQPASFDRACRLERLARRLRARAKAWRQSWMLKRPRAVPISDI